MKKNLTLLSSVLLAAILAACSESPELSKQQITSFNEVDFIKGGKVPSLNDKRFLSTVALVNVDTNSGESVSICTGTLIDEDIVLTAAHCVDQVSEKIAVFAVSGIDISNDKEIRSVRRVRAIKIHPQYNPDKYKNTMDVALLRFEGGAISGAQPVPPLNPNVAKSFGKKSTILVAGYGNNKTFSNKGAGVLRYMSAKVANEDFSSTEFRTRQFKNGVCYGDSGGPAYYEVQGQQYVAGVTSRTVSLGIANCILSGLFVRVDKVYAWIEAEVAQLKALSIND